MFSAAAHSDVLVQTRPIVPLAVLIDSASPRCVQLFPDHFPELPLYPIISNFIIFSSISMPVSHSFVELQEKLLFHPIFSFLSLFFFEGSLLIQHSIAILFNAFSSFIYSFF